MHGRKVRQESRGQWKSCLFGAVVNLSHFCPVSDGVFVCVCVCVVVWCGVVCCVVLCVCVCGCVVLGVTFWTKY